MREIAISLIKVYQRVVSPLFGSCCRYAPSCSEYAVQALEQHGLVRGCLLAIYRLLRCHPFAGSGPDPVPDVFPCPHLIKKSALSNGSPQRNG